jgi:hypothetical protein
MIAAAPPLAELAARIANCELVSSLAIACSDLADGFASPPDSRRRIARGSPSGASIARSVRRRDPGVRRRRWCSVRSARSTGLTCWSAH